MKIEDLTLKEIKEICVENNRIHDGNCLMCSFYRTCSILEDVPYEWTTEDMKREVKPNE